MTHILLDIETTLRYRFLGNRIDADFIHIAVSEAYDDFLMYHYNNKDDADQMQRYVYTHSLNKITDEYRCHNHTTGLTVIERAERLGVSIRTIEYVLQEARETLKKIKK